MDLQQLPPYAPVATQDSKGNTVVRMFPTMCEMEEDPSRPGYARLKRLQRGSPVRWGMSYVAVGFPANPYTIGAGLALGQTNVPIIEPGYLGKFVVQGGPAAATLHLTDISRGGDRLVSNRVPAGIFDPFAFSGLNPILGHYIDSTITLNVDLLNTGLAGVVISLGFTLI